MPVETEVTKKQYDCNDDQQIFAFPFGIFAKEDLLVLLTDKSTGVETTLDLTTHYTVLKTGNTWKDGGSVVTVAKYPEGKKITIMLDLEYKQTADYREGDSFPAEVTEVRLDYVTRLVKQLNEKLGRAIKFRRSSSNKDIEIAELEAGKAIIANSEADGLEMGPDADEIANAQAYAEAAETAKTAAETAQAKAAESAAGVNLPSIEPEDSKKILQVKTDESGHELNTLAEAGIVSAAANLTADALVVGSGGAKGVKTTTTPALGTPASGTLTNCTGDSIVKVWIQFNGTGIIAIQDSFNVITITDYGVGDYAVTFDTDFANNDFAVAGVTDEQYIVGNRDAMIAGIFHLYVFSVTDGAKTDVARICIIAIGDQ